MAWSLEVDLHPVLVHISDIDLHCSMTGYNSFVNKYLIFDIVDYYKKQPCFYFLGGFILTNALSYFCYFVMDLKFH